MLNFRKISIIWSPILLSFKVAMRILTQFYMVWGASYWLKLLLEFSLNFTWYGVPPIGWSCDENSHQFYWLVGVQWDAASYWPRLSGKGVFVYGVPLGTNSNITTKMWYYTTKKTASFACLEIGCSLYIFNLCIKGIFFGDTPFCLALKILSQGKDKLANQKYLKLIPCTQRSPIRCGGARQRWPTDGEAFRKNDEAWASLTASAAVSLPW